ncbi:ClpP-like protease [Mycobacterium phage SirSheldon]|uniref:ClpP-like protease n=2 Tax=Bongovirus bongo TaxID=1983750 RepID=A0A0M4R074_9CAUD|nr:ClpP-like protein [Mycobacterium phage PegLeg]AGM12309.1 ClpP-like protease [Mycobacterium phage PegLeg]ALF00586.1 ClpP-like protease [Mycobacterium phage Bricole]QUU29258.1 ClpP-like protease [Mycobacterium phage SirSheldon]WNN95641.1 ClpP-like protease [Mycobacterium phage Glaske16]
MSEDCDEFTSQESTYVVVKDGGTTTIKYYFRGYIDQEKVSPFIETMFFWDAEYPDSNWDITINSEGGEIFPSIAAYGALSGYSARKEGGHLITTRVAGLAASGGELLFQAGDIRVGGLMDMLMIHQPLCSYEDTSVSQIRADLDRADQWTHRLALIHAERSHLSVEEFLDKVKQGDWWMFADEAVELGFADEVLS